MHSGLKSRHMEATLPDALWKILSNFLNDRSVKTELESMADEILDLKIGRKILSNFLDNISAKIELENKWVISMHLLI